MSRLVERPLVTQVNAVRASIGLGTIGGVAELFAAPHRLLYMTAEPFASTSIGLAGASTPRGPPARKSAGSRSLVSFALADAVHLALIKSEARPGGNITGIQPYLPGLPAKQLELALEILPHATKVGLLTNLQDSKAPTQEEELQIAAQGLKLHVIVADASQPEEIEHALQAISSAGVDVVIVLQTSMLFSGGSKLRRPL